MKGMGAMTVHRMTAFGAPRPAEAGQPVRRVFVRDLVLACSIGVYRHERDATQRVRINLDLAVPEDGGALDDDIANVVNYEDVVDRVRAAVARGHVNLVETLAENIAAVCLQDGRVGTVRVRVEKLDVFSDAASVGVEIERSNTKV